jgi:aldose 1-epimerase
VLRLRSPRGLALALMDQGATWLSCRVPMPDGASREVLLGCDTPSTYAQQTAYLGATIGRYANRIANSSVAHEGLRFALTPNPGSRHQLHGGPQGFDRRRWAIEEHSDTAVCFSIVSPDGDQGYPGRLQARVTYRLLGDDTIEMTSEATVSMSSPVCLTNHAYFNLDAVHADARSHHLRIAAERYLPVDAELIPLGSLAAVSNTGFDFRQLKSLQQDWLCDEQQHAGAGYDHAFLLDPACADMQFPAAELSASDASLRMRVSTTLPSLQLYTGQFLAGTPSRGGGAYSNYSGVALEPQFLPDSPNHPEWPQSSCWLYPGQTYRHSVRYHFAAS